jgi:hypothetical protein
MSREVRRVPLTWKHPTEHNPYWVHQQYRVEFDTLERILRPSSRLHAHDERFIGLMEDYAGRLAEWEKELAEVRAREGWDWNWNVEYHLTGYQGRDDAAPVIHPWWTFADDGETEVSVTVRDEDHLYELLVAKVESERPDPANYMPTWDVPEDQLGWCLYETVSEGTPTTPVFATAEELIDHLATVGQDYDQKPMRRSAAATLVGQGHSFGSLIAVGGHVYNSSDDADIIADKLNGGERP